MKKALLALVALLTLFGVGVVQAEDQVVVFQASNCAAAQAYTGDAPMVKWTGYTTTSAPIKNDEVGLRLDGKDSGVYMYAYLGSTQKANTVSFNLADQYVISSVRFAQHQTSTKYTKDVTCADTSITRTEDDRYVTFTGNITNDVVFNLASYALFSFVEVTYHYDAGVVLPPKDPTFSLESGKYDLGTSLEIAAEEGADIYYSLSYSKDLEEWQKYTAPITFDFEGTFYLKAKALKNDLESGVVEGTYKIKRVDPTEKGEVYRFYTSGQSTGYPGEYPTLQFTQGQTSMSHVGGCTVEWTNCSSNSFGLNPNKDNVFTITPAYGKEITQVTFGFYKGQANDGKNYIMPASEQGGTWALNPDAANTQVVWEGAYEAPLKFTSKSDVTGLEWIEVIYHDFVIPDGPATNPKISLESGEYLVGKDVYISTTQPYATLEYSFDGESWNAYSGAIVFNEPGEYTLYARAKYGENYSEVITANYKVAYESIDAPEFSLEAGSYEPTQTLSITIPEGSVVKYSINDGYWNTYYTPLTFDTKGEYTVKAQAFKGVSPSEESSVTFTINHTKAILSFSATEARVKVGNTFNAPTLSNPKKAPVAWTSSNPEVATVDETGVVTIVEEGVTTITAACAGNDEFTAASASYTLTVEGLPKSGRWLSPQGEEIAEFTIDFDAYKSATEAEKAAMVPTFEWNNEIDSWRHRVWSDNEKVAIVDRELENPISIVGVGEAVITTNALKDDPMFVPGYKTMPLKLIVTGDLGPAEMPALNVQSIYNDEVANEMTWSAGVPVAPTNRLAFTAEEGAEVYYSIAGGDFVKYEAPIVVTEENVGNEIEIKAYAAIEGRDNSEVAEFNVAVKNWVLVENQAMYDNNKYFMLAAYSDKDMAYYLMSEGRDDNGNFVLNANNIAIENNYRKVTNAGGAVIEKTESNVWSILNAIDPQYNQLSRNGEVISLAVYGRVFGVTIDGVTSEATATMEGRNLKLKKSEQQFMLEPYGNQYPAQYGAPYMYTWADATSLGMTYTVNGKAVSEIAKDEVYPGDVITISVPFGYTMTASMNDAPVEVVDRTATFTIPVNTALVAINAQATAEGMETLTFAETFEYETYSFEIFANVYDNEGNMTETNITETMTAQLSFGDKVRVVAPQKAASVYYKEKYDADWKVKEGNEFTLTFPRSNGTYEYEFKAYDNDEHILCIYPEEGMLWIGVNGTVEDKETSNRHSFKTQTAFGATAASESIEELRWLATESRPGSHMEDGYEFFVPCSSEVALVSGVGLVINDGSVVRLGLNDKDGRRITKVVFKGDNIEGLRIGRYMGGEDNAHLMHTYQSVGTLGALQGDGSITWEYDPNDDFNLREVEIWHNPAARSAAPRRAAMKVAANATAAQLHEVTLSSDQPTGIDAVVEAVDGNAMWFDMNGNRVAGDTLKQGLYIKVVGNTATKVIVK